MEEVSGGEKEKDEQNRSKVGKETMKRFGTMAQHRKAVVHKSTDS